MFCRDAMKKNVECMKAGNSAMDVARLMRDKNIGFVPVCDKAGKVVGTVTDRDLTIRVLAEGRSLTVAAAEVMTTDVISCRPEDDIRVAQDLMATHHKSRILCIDTNGVMVGVISLSDIVASVDGSSAIRTFREIASREVRV